MKITKKFKGMLSFALTAMLTLGTVNVGATTTSKNPALPDTDPNKTGSITIHKYGMSDWPNPGTSATGNELNKEDIPTGAVPLKGIKFTVQEVIADENGTLTASNSSEKYSAVENKDSITLTTNEEGIDTTGQIAQGTYLVTESQNSSVAKPVDPFIVNVPMTNHTGDGWIYDVHVYPKNVLAGKASIDKDVTKEDNKHDTADIGKNVTWIIKPSIPQDIFYSKKYAVVDQLDSQLNYTGNLKVYYLEENNVEEIIPSQYYKVIEPEKTFKENEITGPTEGQVIKVEFNKAGREFLSTLFANSINSIRISFTTTINESAKLGVAIKNNANLVYTNSFDEIVGSDPTEPGNPDVPGEPGNPDVPGEPDQPTPPVIDVPTSGNDKPEVHTGGLLLEKVDAADSNIKLGGAKFKIYPSLVDAQNGTNAILNPENNKEEWEVTTVKTEENPNGQAIFRGLAYGTYYIVETVAPTYDVVVGKDENGENIIEKKHYNLLKAPLEVTVSATSHLETNKVVVANSKFTLPVTGGMGTVIFTLGGLAIMGAAAFLYMRTTRRA